MSVGYLGAKRAVRPLDWSERGAQPFAWWETTRGELTARVTWLGELGKVMWSICEGERTLALGYVESDEAPGEAQIEKAKRSAAQRWWELHA